MPPRGLWVGGRTRLVKGALTVDAGMLATVLFFGSLAVSMLGLSFIQPKGE
jgi:hypothetical protein